MPHRPRPAVSRWYQKGEERIAKLPFVPRDQFNLKYLNNPRLSKNQRSFIVRAYKKAHPEQATRERQKKRFKEKHANISKAEMHRRRRAAEKARRKRP